LLYRGGQTVLDYDIWSIDWVVGSTPLSANPLKLVLIKDKLDH